jgi:hypothetical protein
VQHHAAWSGRRHALGADDEVAVRAVLSSLGAFAAAGLRPRTPLAKAIVAVLLIKLVGITAARLFVFTDEARPPADAAAIAHVMGVSAGASSPAR